MKKLSSETAKAFFNYIPDKKDEIKTSEFIPFHEDINCIGDQIGSCCVSCLFTDEPIPFYTEWEERRRFLGIF